MTNIVVTIRDGEATAKLTGILTNGMVGVPVFFDLGPEWEDLTVIAVIRGNDLTFDRPLLGTRQTTVPFEVLEKVGEHIYIGAEGCSASGDLVIQSNMAKVEEPVRQGADPSGDIAMDPTQPFWAELMHEVEELRKGVAERVKTVNGIAPDENGNVNVYGVSAEEKKLILSLLRNAAYTADMSATFAQLAELWGIEVPDEPDIPDEPEEPDVPVVTLTSISATYSGGDVPVGTAVTDLTGIVVTAHYSDGTSKAVTDYTLSGTIAEGANTITVNYGGKSTTFAVTGVAEEEPESTEPVYQLAEATAFDGTAGGYDTNYALFANGGEYDYTIAFEVSVTTKVGIIWSIVTAQSNNHYLQFYKEGGWFNSIKYCGGSRFDISSGGITNLKAVITHTGTTHGLTVYYAPNGELKSGDVTGGTAIGFTDPSEATIKFGGTGDAGTMHDFKVYNRVLTEDEIKAYLGVSA